MKREPSKSKFIREFVPVYVDTEYGIIVFEDTVSGNFFWDKIEPVEHISNA